MFYLSQRNVRRVLFFPSLGRCLCFGVLLRGLAGLPPFAGFFAKRLALSIIVRRGYYLVAVGLVLTTCLRLAFYLNLFLIGVVASMRRDLRPRGIEVVTVVVGMGLPVLFGCFMVWSLWLVPFSFES